MYSLNSKYGKLCLSVDEVAFEMGVSEEAVKSLVDEGKLLPVKVGDEILITVSALERFLGICQQNLDISSDLSYHTTNSADGWIIDTAEGDEKMLKGSVTYVKGSDRWIAQFDMGKTPDGKRIRKSKSFKTEDEARNALALELAKIYPESSAPEIKVPTYEELANEFLNARNSTATGRTWDTYIFYSKYSINSFGKKRIDEIDKSDVIKMFDTLKVKYKDSTLKKTKTIAGMVFDYAIEKGFIKNNVIKAVKKIPKSEVNVSEDDIYKALTDEEMKYILSIGKENKSFNGMLFMLAYTGMRPGELRALKVSDIDLEKETVHIQRAASVENVYDSNGKRIGKREYVKDTKNGSYGHRILHVPRYVLEMALKQREYMLSDKKYRRAKKSVYLFPDTNGDFIREYGFNKRWRMFREKNNLDFKKYFPYVFRHTMCTNLIKAGTPVATVQRIIGDNTVDVIMKVYTHINSSDIADAMEDVYNAYTSLLSK